MGMASHPQPRHATMLRLLLAALWLVARLAAPVQAMPAQLAGSGPGFGADPVARMMLQAICHADGSRQAASEGAVDGQGPAPAAPMPSGHADCLLCPACHLVSHAAVPLPGTPALPPAPQRLAGWAAPLPPATGPPPRKRTAAQPTGPPTAL